MTPNCSLYSEADAIYRLLAYRERARKLSLHQRAVLNESIRTHGAALRERTMRHAINACYESGVGVSASFVRLFDGLKIETKVL